jgi:ParB/RepB/Spo0J family partition protein
MPLSDTYIRLATDLIYVKRDERQRREIEVEDLKKSISQIGLINPIIVREEAGNYTLIAGERRLMAFKALNIPEIPVRFAHELSPIEASIIELEENIKRKDLPWQDLVRAVAKLHELHSSLQAKWTQDATAEALSLAKGTVSVYLKVSTAIDDPRILECATVRQAYDVLDRRDSRKVSAALANLFDQDHEEGEEGEEEGEWEEDEAEEEEGAQISSVVPLHIHGETSLAKRPKRSISNEILHANFLEWAPQYSGRRFNFLHVDFPYGMSEIGPQMRGNEHTMYEDSPALYVNLLNCFCENLDHFFADIGWCMFWYSERMGNHTKAAFKFKAPSMNVQTFPLIWLHSDNAGISPDPQRRPRHIYDTCLLMSRGEMPLIKVKSDAYASPTDHKLHPSTKPVPMLKHFFEMFVDEHTSLFDPTCGSGAALRAAEALGASRVLGIESNWEHCENARRALIDDRKVADIWKAI